jgi:DNA-binding protein WhiA
VRVEGNRALQAAEELRIERERSLREAGSAGAAYLRGAFQGAGSVIRPSYRRGHHLEFVHEDEEFVRRIARLSRAPLRVTKRRGRWVAYTKSADGVTTLLAQIGLHEAVLEYETQAILGEAKANANRVTNFDAANAARIAAAAARQQEILESLDPKSLPEALREMLELRLEHPDASLAELARLGGLSKSAVNHRLRRLTAASRQRSAFSSQQGTKGR